MTMSYFSKKRNQIKTLFVLNNLRPKLIKVLNVGFWSSFVLEKATSCFSFKLQKCFVNKETSLNNNWNFRGLGVCYINKGEQMTTANTGKKERKKKLQPLAHLLESDQGV